MVDEFGVGLSYVAEVKWSRLVAIGEVDRQRWSIGWLDVYVAAVVILALGFTTLTYDRSILEEQALTGIAIWIALVIIADLTPITLPRGNAVLSVGGAIDFGIVLLFPTFLAALSGLISGLVSSLVRKVELRRILFNMGMNCLTMVVTSEVITVLGGKIYPLSQTDIVSWPLAPMLGAYLVAAIVYFLVNTGLTSFAISASTHVPVVSVWATNYMWTIASSLAVAPIGFILAVVYHVLSDNMILAIFGISIFILPLIVLRSSFKWFTSVNETYFSAIRALVNALDASHHYTQGHSRRVSENSASVARYLRLPTKEIETIEQGAILHDIGKIGLDKSILDKDGPLNSLEWARMKQHPTLGWRIIKDLAFLRNARDIILHHHERIDGRGYPSGLAGEAIPFAARIVNVVDAFDALTSNRSYRPALSVQEALEILRANAGRQFDATVVESLEDLLRRSEIILQADDANEQDFEVLFTIGEIAQVLQPMQTDTRGGN